RSPRPRRRTRARKEETMRTVLAPASFLAVTLAGVLANPGLAQPPADNPEAEAALLKKAEAFVEAFHRGDAPGLAAFWTADRASPDQPGKHSKGRAAIEQAFGAFFAEHKGLKLRIDIASLRFVTPDVAVEDGTPAVIPPDGGPPSRARYTIVHVKKGGEW